jgi:DNA-binding transcriptional LysR family regulator
MECLSDDFAAGLFEAIQSRFRQFTLDIFVGGTAVIVEKILASELDFAVCFNVPDRPNIRKLKVLEAPSGIIVSKDHPLAGETSVPLSVCISYPFILPDFTLAARRMIDQTLSAASVQVVPSLVTNSTSLMKRLLDDDQHIAFLNAGNLLDADRRNGLKFLPLANRQIAAEELSLITRSSQTLNSAMTTVVDIIKGKMDDLPIHGKSA